MAGKRILIIPGWMPTMSDYKKLSNDLNASMYLPKGKDFNEMSSSLRSYLMRTNFDVVIGFDMSASLLLNSAQRGDVILVNPFYKEVNGFAYRMDASILSTMKISPVGVKLVGLFMVNSMGKMSKEFVDNFMHCNPDYEATRIRTTMDTSVDRVATANFKYVYSERDRIIPQECRQMLIDNYKLTEIEKVPGGHTPILECYPVLLEKLRKLVG